MTTPGLPAGLGLEALLEALDSASIGLTIILDDAGRLERVYANAAIAAIYGRDLAAMRSVPALAPFTPEEEARISGLFGRTQFDRATDDLPLELKTIVARPDGSSIPVDVQLGHTRFGSALATFVFVRDISAETRMAEALRESEERFRAVAESVPDSIAVFADGKYLYANPIAREHLRLGPDDDLGAVDPRAGMSPERLREGREYIARLRAGERLPAVTTRRTSREGNEQVLESRLSVAKMGGREVIIATTRDITERVYLQAELMKQDRLASLGLLAAGVAHEINNPLTALTMQARRLRQNAAMYDLPDEVKDSVGQIEEAAERMSAIIADLLFMARPVDRVQAHINVAQVLESSLALLRAGTKDSPEMNVDIPPLPPIHGYSSKLGQVFLNVLRNAVQAVDGRAGGKIEVRARALVDQLEITIEDNGAGIAPEVLPLVTQPFFTDKVGGTGLGLWISQTLMAQHGGSLDIASCDRGTTVTLRLPTTPLPDRS